jgi:hypothetical protein
MKTMLGIIMVLHGIAHGVGFAGAWGLSRNIPYKTTVLNGHIDMGPVGIRLVGVLWLLAGLTFVIAAVTAFTNQPTWLRATAIALIASTVLTAFELPEAKIGLALNGVMAVALIAFVTWQRA